MSHRPATIGTMSFEMTAAEYVYREGSSDKFYRLYRAGSMFATQYGRAGTYGTFGTKVLADDAAAIKAFDAETKKCHSKGYVLSKSIVVVTDTAPTESWLDELMTRTPAGTVGDGTTTDAPAPASGIAGVRADLAIYLADQQPSEQHLELARLVEAESLLLHGATAAALQLTGDLAIAPDHRVSARLLLLRGHCLRILGSTSEAIVTYQRVWSSPAAATQFDRERRAAGIWTADLKMASGDFVGAHRLVDELLEEPSADERVTLLRLRHLAYRFSFEHDLAMAWLKEAEAAVGDDELMRANLMTNRVELEALVDPHQALARFDAALSAQQELGAEPELGKLWCARGLAEFSLGDLDACSASLSSGIRHLENAGYRSGQARAHLYLAALWGRWGDVDRAVDAADRAVELLADSEVYPTLRVVAVRLCESLGRPSPVRTRAEKMARSMIRLPGSDNLDESIDNSAILRWTTRHPTSPPTTGQEMAGFYNRNIRVDDVVLRTRLLEAPVMDLAIWNEADVLAAVNRYLACTPRLLALFRADATQIHEFVPGRTLDEMAPKGHDVPSGCLGQLAEFFAELSDVPETELPELPAGWPKPGDTQHFAAKLMEVTEAVRRRYETTHRELWAKLAIPADPLSALDWRSLEPRAFSLIHCDVHRKNLIWRPDDRLVVLDWELALWGDPVYDIAVHLHKMGYSADEEADILERWLAGRSEDRAQLVRDVETYRRHETLKSAIVDSVRYQDLILGGAPPDRCAALIESLTQKLNRARLVWGQSTTCEPAEVEEALRAQRGA